MKTNVALLSIPPNSAAIATARRFTAAFLRNRELVDLIDTMVLLVSEVVTNAILHSGSGAELRLSLSGAAVKAEVRDRSVVLPSLKQYSDSATTGRGMLIVESLATAWGTEVDDEGKVVWFSVDAASYIAEPVYPESSDLPLQRFHSAGRPEAVLTVTPEDIEDDAQGGMLAFAGSCC